VLGSFARGQLDDREVVSIFVSASFPRVSSYYSHYCTTVEVDLEIKMDSLTKSGLWIALIATGLSGIDAFGKHVETNDEEDFDLAKSGYRASPVTLGGRRLSPE